MANTNELKRLSGTLNDPLVVETNQFLSASVRAHRSRASWISFLDLEF